MKKTFCILFFAYVKKNHYVCVWKHIKYLMTQTCRRYNIMKPTLPMVCPLLVFTPPPI